MNILNERIQQLVDILNEARRIYEQENRQLMSDFEYDKLYDELLGLEAKTGVVLENSPTVRVGHEVVSQLVKVRHDAPLLSLDKTKEIAKLEAFLQVAPGILSWKLDGLTIVLKYSGGALVQALTRGNGEIGEDVTHNGKFFRNIPRRIDYTGNLSIRGEAVISFGEFERINSEIEDGEYKNPRNLCAGTIRQLNSRIAAGRNVDFFAFAVLEGPDFVEKSEGLQFLEREGFAVADYKPVNPQNIAAAVEDFKLLVNDFDYATDGLVLTYDNINFSNSLGSTSKFPRDSIAFKWADELAQTRLLGIEWNTSRTGLINPIAIFEAVEIEGSTVERASLHNVSIAEALRLGVGDEITVYKANMIIPQIAENRTQSGFGGHPALCPVCAAATQIKEENDVKTLHCTNPNCRARVVRTIAHFAGRDAANIEGFSIATIEKFIELGFLSNFSDIYSLQRFEAEITGLRGFGEKSFANLMTSIEKSKDIALPNFIYGLGIDNVGLAGAKALCGHFDFNFQSIRKATPLEFIAIEGFGEIIAASLHEYFQNPENNAIVDAALPHLNFTTSAPPATQANPEISGKTFVITGELAHFKNRKELAEQIEAAGGKVVGSVSKKTDFLVNNDAESQSSKNKKAQELGVKIITEAEFLGLFGPIRKAFFDDGDGLIEDGGEHA
ncbi:MAG: NAD-dependent DNA ligase LigA [Clostridiales bacterium]|nr:NAD-dependent DNA ligase LigA [Clostridiales bacterium]